MQDLPTQMRKMLEESRGAATPLYVHGDRDDLSDYLIGCILDVTTTYFAIWTFTLEGIFDGIVVGINEDIARISTGGPLLEHLARMGKDLASYASTPQVGFKADLVGTLRAAMESREVVTISDRSGERSSGIMTSVDDHCVQFREIVHGGRVDGLTMMRLEDIKTIELRGPDQIALRELTCLP